MSYDNWTAEPEITVWLHANGLIHFDAWVFVWRRNHNSHISELKGDYNRRVLTMKEAELAVKELVEEARTEYQDHYLEVREAKHQIYDLREGV